jgi:hypothetical protein
MVMPQARRFIDLEVEGTQEALSDLTPIETAVRPVRPDRDLNLVGSNKVGSSERHEANGSTDGFGANS